MRKINVNVNISIMPRRYKRGGRGRKRLGRKGFKMFKNLLREKTRRGNQIVAKLRLLYNVSNTLANQVDTAFKVADVATAQDWSNYSEIYDTFRVCGMKLKFIPYANTVSFSETASSPFLSFNAAFVAWDPDSTTTATMNTQDEIIQYENCKIKNVLRPFTYYVKCPKITSDGTSYMFNGGYCDVNTASSLPGLIGMVCFNNYSQSEPIGQGIVTFYVSFKNRR